MNVPQMFEPRPVAVDTWMLPAFLPVPGFGMLAANAFVIQAAQPVLVDTGLAALREDFLKVLGSVMDPVDLRWIWITHMDPDHIGNLEAILRVAPYARVVTNFLGMGKLNLHGLPVERAYLLNPGQELDVGDRRLLAVRPPVFDAPETVGLFDPRTGTWCSSDCFGALLSEAVEAASDLALADLRQGMISWAMVDAPWLSMVSTNALRSRIAEIDELALENVLSSHLPPACGITSTLFEQLVGACGASPFIGPDQAALEAMLGATETAA